MAMILVGGAAVVLVGGAAVAGAGAAAGAGAIAYRRYKRNKKRKELFKKNQSILFTEPLESLHPKYITPGSGVPVVVELTCSLLEKTGAEVEGIFRIPGSTGRIKELESIFETGKEEDILAVNWQEESPHDIGGVFKLYFRKMPEGLCTFALFDQFIAIEREEENDIDRWAERMREVIYKLPDMNLRVFLRIIPFFYYVSTLSATNLMSVDNIAIVFGGVIFSNDDRSPEAMLEQSAIVGRLLSKIITNKNLLLHTSLNDLPPYEPKIPPIPADLIDNPADEKKKEKKNKRISLFKRKSKISSSSSDLIISSPSLQSASNFSSSPNILSSNSPIENDDEEDDEEEDDSYYYDDPPLPLNNNNNVPLTAPPSKPPPKPAKPLPTTPERSIPTTPLPTPPSRPAPPSRSPLAKPVLPPKPYSSSQLLSSGNDLNHSASPLIPNDDQYEDSNYNFNQPEEEQSQYIVPTPQPEPVSRSPFGAPPAKPPPRPPPKASSFVN